MKDREKLEFILKWLSNNAKLEVISEKNEALRDDAYQLFIALDNLMDKNLPKGTTKVVNQNLLNIVKPIKQ